MSSVSRCQPFVSSRLPKRAASSWVETTPLFASLLAVLTTGVQAGDEHEDTFPDVRLTATVITDATQEQVENLGAEVERRCPVSALFRRAGTHLTSTWTAQVPVGSTR